MEYLPGPSVDRPAPAVVERHHTHAQGREQGPAEEGEEVHCFKKLAKIEISMNIC